MKDRALILAPFTDSALGTLRETTHVTYESWLDTRRIQDPEALAARMKEEDIRILVVEADFVFEEVFETAPCLRFVGVCRNDTSHVDVEAATQHGVVVVNTPARNARGVAEHALGLMLSLARRIPMADEYVRSGQWQNPAEPYISMRGVELAGRTLGIIGLGAVGQRLAQMAGAIGMEVLAYDPYVDGASLDVRLVELDSLMAESDFVSIHAPSTKETVELVNSHRIGLMKPTAYLVNLSDANVVAENALVSALREERIAGAAIDVFETQPLAPDSPLLLLDNMVLTPHLGGATAETIERHSGAMANDIQRYLAGQLPKNLVNPEVWDRNG